MKHDQDILEKVLDSIHNNILTHDSIGLFISGGFDSSILAYIVFKYVHENNLNKKITIYVVPRHDDSLIHAERVCKSVSCNLLYDFQIVGNPNLIHNLQVWSGISEASKNKDILYIADTKNPEAIPNGPNRPSSYAANQFHPFLNYNKTLTIQLAQHFNVLELISSISHTCTENPLMRCDKCWQCQERAWAFKFLDLQDVGTM